MEEPKVITIDDVFDSTVMHINDFPRPNSTLRPGSDTVLHMSRIEFNELSSCEVRRLNQFETADILRIGSAVLHAWLSREYGCGPALIQTPIFT